MATDAFASIKKEIDAALKTALDAVGREIGYEIETIYESVIDEFYNSYTPRRYRRTESTYYGSDSYLLAKDPVIEGATVTAGIEVSPDNIQGNPYRANKDWVFERTFVKGYHGYKDKEIREWRQRPHIRELIKAGKYHFYRPDDMVVMNPPPKKLMEKRIRNSKKEWKQRINDVFTAELTKALG